MLTLPNSTHHSGSSAAAALLFCLLSSPVAAQGTIQAQPDTSPQPGQSVRLQLTWPRGRAAILLMRLNSGHVVGLGEFTGAEPQPVTWVVRPQATATYTLGVDVPGQDRAWTDLQVKVLQRNNPYRGEVPLIMSFRKISDKKHELYLYVIEMTVALEFSYADTVRILDHTGGVRWPADGGYFRPPVGRVFAQEITLGVIEHGTFLILEAANPNGVVRKKFLVESGRLFGMGGWSQHSDPEPPAPTISRFQTSRPGSVSGSGVETGIFSPPEGSEAGSIQGPAGATLPPQTATLEEPLRPGLTMGVSSSVEIRAWDVCLLRLYAAGHLVWESADLSNRGQRFEETITIMTQELPAELVLRADNLHQSVARTWKASSR